MSEIFYLPSTMIWPLMACLILTGIHVYLGVHVIARKVIFVDLALAQIAALGTVIGVLLGYEAGKDANSLYLYSLAFTFFGAFIFSATKMRGERVPHEAIIGIVYAVTFAATILILSRSPLGPQELDHIIKGELLWVNAELVIKTAVIYSLIGIFHYVFRKKFILISFKPDTAEEIGIKVRLWDFLFYMSFGFVITSSVAIAGVFLVFSYLIIPAVAAILFSEKLANRLAIGWIGGSVISLIGVKLSWHTGLPTSPLIVVLLAAALILGAAVQFFRRAPAKGRAVFHAFASLVVIGLFIAGVYFFRKPQENPFDHTLHLLRSPLSTDRQSALADLEGFQDRKSEWLPLCIGRLKDEDAEVRKTAVGLIGKIGERKALPQILELLADRSDEVRHSVIGAAKILGDSATAELLVKSATQTETDEDLKIDILETALELGNPHAIPPLIGIIEQKGIFSDDAYDHLTRHVQVEFSADEVSKAKRWWEENHGKLTWNPATKMFISR